MGDRAESGRKCGGEYEGQVCRHPVLCAAQDDGFCLLVHNRLRKEADNESSGGEGEKK